MNCGGTGRKGPILVVGRLIGVSQLRMYVIQGSWLDAVLYLHSLHCVACDLIVACDLFIAACDLLIAACDLFIAACDLLIAACDLFIAACDLLIVACDLLIAACVFYLQSERRCYHGTGVSKVFVTRLTP